MERITLRYLVHEIPHRLLHLDRGFVPTLWNLLVHPQRVVNGYLDGQRARWFNPLGLLVLLAGLSVVLFTRIPFDMSPMSRSMGALADDWERFMRLNFEYYSASLVLYVPLSAALSWMVFAGRGRNYAEHLVINSYALAASTLLMPVAAPALVLTSGTPYFGLVWMAMAVGAFLVQLHLFVRTFLSSGTVLGTVVRSVVHNVLYTLMVSLLPQLAFLVWIGSKGRSLVGA